MYYTNHYVIDWSKVNTLEQIKTILMVLDISFEPNCPAIEPIKELLILKDKMGISNCIPACEPIKFMPENPEISKVHIELSKSDNIWLENTVSDLFSDFLFYDRKTDNKMDSQRLSELMKDGFLSKENMIKVFMKQINKAYSF